MKTLLSIAAMALCAVGLGAQAPQSFDDTIPLSRAAAVAATLANNPQLEVAREQTAQARARRVQGIAVPDPQFTFGFDNNPGVLNLRNAATRDAALGISVPFPDKFRLRNKIGKAEIATFEYSYTGLRQLLVSTVSATYDSLLVARRHQEILRTGRDLAADFLRKTQARYEGGTAAKLDVVRAQTAVAQAESDLIGIELDILTATDALDRLMGRTPGQPITPTDSLALPPPLPLVVELQQTALANRPELGSLTAQQLGAKASTALAREFWLPDLTLGFQRDYGPEGSGGLFSAGIALPFPVFFWQHTKGEIAEGQHRERELAATERDLRAQVLQDVRASYASASTTLRQAIYIRDALLPTAREAYRVASVSYGLGGSSALEVLDARRELLDAETQYADALAAANTSRADLERAVATPLSRFATGRTP